MDSCGIAQIAPELCDLLQLQLDSIIGRRLTELTPEEMDAFRKRKIRISELRSELNRFANPT
jgi:hypothetical protein